MVKGLIFLVCCLGILRLEAQSRLEYLLKLDPLFSIALDSAEAGSPALAIAMLKQGSTQFKAEEKWTKYAGVYIVLGKIYFQEKQLDSALVALKKAAEIGHLAGNQRLIANVQEGVARIYMAKQDYGLAMQHYQLFANWCLAEGMPKAKVQTCLQLAQIYIRKMEPDSIRRYLRLGLSLSKAYDFPILQYKLFQLGGVCWNNIGRPDSALYYFHQSLGLLEKHPAEVKKTNVYLSIAHVFLDNHNPKRARKYLNLAKSSAQKSEKALPAAMILYYEGLTLLVEKKAIEAKPVLEKALKAFKRLPEPEKHHLMQARTLQGLAEVYHELGADEKALDYLRQTKILNIKVMKRHIEMQGELMEAAILSSQDALDASDELLMENLNWAKKSANLNYQIQLYETLAANARKAKNYEQAIFYIEKVNGLKEKIDPLDQASLLSNAELDLETGKQNSSIHNLTLANSKKAKHLKTTLFLLLSGMALLMLASWLVYRKIQRKAVLLEVEKQQMELALQEKELLLKEIHHRVKNNMQVISSLLNLQSKGIQDPVALKVMRDGRDRVRSMALIHQSLYQNQNYSNVETQDYFLKLAENLFHTYNIDQNKIQLIAQIQPLRFNIDIMITLGLILNELISNSLKYAFPDDQTGELRIFLALQAEQVELKVEDNGIGLPPDFSPDANRSIGYSLMQAFTQKLGGSLQIQNADQGARASLIFPLNNEIIAA